MASSLDFLELVLEQLDGVGELDYKRMFAEYCVYVNQKPLILIIEDQIYLKKLPALKDMMDGVELEVPYPGLHERYVIDVDDRELLREAVIVAEENSPQPKPKKLKA
jgi:TfoX/Sxy family transcriptional regulator of competence genes